MIWDKLDATSFRLTYQTMLLSLEGAIARSADTLTRSPVAALRQGMADVATIESMLPGIQAAAGNLLRSAAELGATGAGTSFSEGMLHEARQALDATVAQIFARDVLKARSVIRAQAVRYSAQPPGTPPLRAKLEATSELGIDAFSQLDRAGRRFTSLDLVDGHVRMAAAMEYAKQFCAAAVFWGAEQVLLRKPGEQDVKLSPRSLPVEEFFHPNTTAELALP